MPRKFDFRRDFSQLDQQKSPKEYLEELSDKQIQNLVDEAFESVPVDVQNIEVREKSIRFTCYPITGKQMGIFRYFLDDSFDIEGEIYLVGGVKPVYRATFRGSCRGYGFSQDVYYEMKYGTKGWVEKSK